MKVIRKEVLFKTKENLKYGLNIDIANATKKDMIEILKTEEPGSKQLLASQYSKIENVAYDRINHLINDCIVMGSKPLAVQDAIICSKINKEDISNIVKTIRDACKKQGCVLQEGTYILTFSIVGVVEKAKIIDGSKIEEGDIVLGLESSGIHTNGYTMVRILIEKHPEILDVKINKNPFIDKVILKKENKKRMQHPLVFQQDCIHYL